MSYSLDSFETYNSRNILIQLNCIIYSCIFLNINNNNNGVAIYYSNLNGNFSILYSSFNSCRLTTTDGSGGTFYLNCLNIKNFGIQIFNCIADFASSGFSKCSNLNSNECFSSSFCKGRGRSFYSNNGNINKKSFNLSNLIISTGVMDRYDPSLGCNVLFTNFISSKPAAEINIQSSFKNTHYLSFINIYNCSNKDGYCIQVNSPSLVVIRYLYASFYFPKSMISLVSNINPKIYDSILEQTALNVNYNAGNNSLGNIYSHQNFLKNCKFIQIKPTHNDLNYLISYFKFLFIRFFIL